MQTDDAASVIDHGPARVARIGEAVGDDPVPDHVSRRLEGGAAIDDAARDGPSEAKRNTAGEEHLAWLESFGVAKSKRLDRWWVTGHDDREVARRPSEDLADRRRLPVRVFQNRAVGIGADDMVAGHDPTIAGGDETRAFPISAAGQGDTNGDGGSKESGEVIPGELRANDLVRLSTAEQRRTR